MKMGSDSPEQLHYYYCITTALLLHYYCITTALLLHYHCITTSLLLDYYLIITALLPLLRITTNYYELLLLEQYCVDFEIKLFSKNHRTVTTSLLPLLHSFDVVMEPLLQNYYIIMFWQFNYYSLLPLCYFPLLPLLPFWGVHYYHYYTRLT